MKMPTLNSTVTIAVAAVLVGCASTPKNVAELDTARASVKQVEADPLAGQVASQEVARAHDSLRAADRAMENKDIEEVKQQAYLAQRHADIATQQIAGEQARQTVAHAEEQRQKAQLEASSRKNEQLQEQLKEMQAKQTDAGIVLTLGDVLFDTGKATLKPGATHNVDRLANFLQQNAERNVIVEGHTDSTGSMATNMELSQQRADAVKAALMERGVQGNRIMAVGKGPELPVASNSTAAGRQQNRRVVVTIQNQANRG